MTQSKELEIVREAVIKIRDAPNHGAIEDIIRHTLLEIQSSCGATKGDALHMLHSGIVSSVDDKYPNLLYASAILDKLA